MRTIQLKQAVCAATILVGWSAGSAAAELTVTVLDQQGQPLALVEDLIAAMEQHDIAVSAQNRLLAILAAMHKEVVNL